MTDELEHFYSGDEAWTNFVRAFEPEWTAYPYQDDLVAELGGQVDIAKVVAAEFGDGALEAIYSPVPALASLSMAQCVLMTNFVLRLREMLMRMPR